MGRIFSMENTGQGKLKVAKQPLISPLVKGYFVITFVLFIWSSFALSIRAIGHSSLAPADVALIRFLTPILILSPFIPARFKAMNKVRISDLLLILLGGVPFFFFAALGAKSAPTACVGTLLAGTPPFFVALLLWAFCKQQISKIRAIALALVLIGVCTMLTAYISVMSTEIIVGLTFLICASFAWALYTIGLKRTKLDVISITLLISICSLFITSILIWSGFVESHWGTFSLNDALPFIVVQGLLVGLLATMGYSYAVNQLGSTQASTIGSLSPGLTALLAVPVFNESLSSVIVLGIFLTMSGVALSNRF